MSPAEKIYVLWSVMAVQGLMSQSDSFLRQYKKQIYSTARKLSMKLPKEMELYRGILLEPNQIKSGEAGDTIKEKWPVEYLSFTEDPEVACWFAAVDSRMSESVLNQRPGSQGFIIKHTASPSEVLFHHTWHNILNIKSLLPWVDVNLAANGMHTDLSQYVFNIKTQSEVILKPTDHEFELIPAKDLCQLSGKQLDKKFFPKWIP